MDIAEDYLNRSIEMAEKADMKTFRDALSWKTCLKVDMKQSDQMIKEYKSKVSSVVEDDIYRNALITVYLLNNQLNEAEILIKRCLEEECEEWFLYQSLGDIHYRMKRYDEALISFQKALVIDSETYCDTYYSLILLFEALSEIDKAIDICHRWVNWYDKRGAIIEKEVPKNKIIELEKRRSEKGVIMDE
jgi:tetratricopeptide (TPR) repeat protein